MFIIVDPGSGVPVYRQIIDQIRFQIGSGRLNAGDELPSTRALSGHLGVNPMTVSKAYASLEQDGELIRRPGKPLLVAALDIASLTESRRSRVRDDLRPAVIRLRQLGLTDTDALAIFQTLLQETPADEETTS